MARRGAAADRAGAPSGTTEASNGSGRANGSRTGRRINGTRTNGTRTNGTPVNGAAPGDEPGARTIGALAVQRWAAREPGGGSGPAKPQGEPTQGPFDEDDLDPDRTHAERVDFGAVRIPVPRGGQVSVEPEDGRLQAVHVMLPAGRLSVSALAAPRSELLWPDLAAEIDESLREGGAIVRSYTGEWGRELHARTGEASSVFVGVDGPRWMLYGVATGPSSTAAELDAALRQMLRGTVVVRGRSPYPVRTVLPLTVPEQLAEAGEQASAGPARPESARASRADGGSRPSGPRATPAAGVPAARSAEAAAAGAADRGGQAPTDRPPAAREPASAGSGPARGPDADLTMPHGLPRVPPGVTGERAASVRDDRVEAAPAERVGEPAARPPQLRVADLIAQVERERTVAPPRASRRATPSSTTGSPAAGRAGATSPAEPRSTVPHFAEPRSEPRAAPPWAAEPGTAAGSPTAAAAGSPADDGAATVTPLTGLPVVPASSGHSPPVTWPDADLAATRTAVGPPPDGSDDWTLPLPVVRPEPEPEPPGEPPPPRRRRRAAAEWTDDDRAAGRSANRHHRPARHDADAGIERPVRQAAPEPFSVDERTRRAAPARSRDEGRTRHAAPGAGADRAADRAGGGRVRHAAPEPGAARVRHAAPEPGAARVRHAAPGPGAARVRHAAPEPSEAQVRHAAPGPGGGPVRHAAPEHAAPEEALPSAYPDGDPPVDVPVARIPPPVPPAPAYLADEGADQHDPEAQGRHHRPEGRAAGR